MSQKFTKQELYELRNFVPIDDLIRKLQIPCKLIEGYFRFLCPLCNEFRTATKPDTNLARCFLCARNFNTIDMTLICRRVSFVEGVGFLQAFYADIQKRKRRQAELEQRVKRMIKAA